MRILVGALQLLLLSEAGVTRAGRRRQGFFCLAFCTHTLTCSQTRLFFTLTKGGA